LSAVAAVTGWSTGEPACCAAADQWPRPDITPALPCLLAHPAPLRCSARVFFAARCKRNQADCVGTGARAGSSGRRSAAAGAATKSENTNSARSRPGGARGGAAAGPCCATAAAGEAAPARDAAAAARTAPASTGGGVLG
jgi:hypothetical protein